MKRSINFLSILTLTTSLLTFTACDKLQDIQPETTPQGATRQSATNFDPALFASKIEARLTGKVPGFGYRIWVNGQPYNNGKGGGGYARRAIDAPAREYTSSVRQGVGSCSKLMTALLVIKVLERNGRSIEEKVWPYCPSYFKPSEDFKKVTFRDLLAHTSGVLKHGHYSGEEKGQLADMQDSYEDGIYDADDYQGQILNGPLPKKITDTKPFGQYAYSNNGYGICRVAVPYLVAKLENPALLQSLKSSEGNYDQINLAVATAFRSLLRTEIFAPAGLIMHNFINFKDWGSPVSQFTKYYSQGGPPAPDFDEDEEWVPANNFANPNQPGTDGGDYFLRSGAGGLYMSADEVAQVVAAMRANKIVKYDIVKLMKSGDNKGRKMGFDGAILGKHGTYYHKNGAGSGNSVLLDFDGRMVNVQVAITTNSKGTDVLKTDVWAKLFDESWK